MAINDQNPIRIPNLPTGKMVDDKGNTSDDELTFRQVLVTNLQKLFGPEGCVVPSQTAADITNIQNNNYVDEGSGETVYTCEFGTILYNSTDNSIMIAVSDGLIPPKPIFKTVTLT
jgi:hypothetical protein